MSRFRFRAWNKENGKWCFFDIPDALFTTTFFCDLEVITTEGKEFEHWCQSTGLPDKHGTEIFEKDLGDLNGEIVMVQYCEGEFILRNKWGQEYSLRTHHNEVEIIGNIHENPELLGEQNG